jgi:LacI family transcriptional regulator
MPPKRIGAAERRSVLLVLGWHVHEIHMGVARYARESGWILNDVASHTGEPPCGWKGHGIITLLPGNALHQEWLKDWLLQTKLPVVDLSDQMPELPFPRVLPDNEAIGCAAATELIGRGFEHLGFYCVNHCAPVERERMAGFRRAVEKAGMTFHLFDYTAQLGRPDALRNQLPRLAQWLRELPKPVGVMAQYDGHATLVVRAAVDAGLNIPEQVAVIGADNDPIYCELGAVPLSSVVTHRDLLGYRGAELLDRLMKGAKPPRQPIRISPSGVMVRRSSDAFAVGDPNVLRALNFIAAHLHEPITVHDIVRASGVSRRGLYLRFEQHVHASVHRELMRQRLARSKQLLRDPGRKMVEIAEACGFEDASAFSKAFRSHEGSSPSAYRAGTATPAIQ